MIFIERLRETYHEVKGRIRKQKFMQPILHWEQKITDIRSLCMVKKLLSEKGDNEIYILLTWAIGDNLYALANIDAIRQRYPDKKIIVYGYKRRAKLLQSYNNIDRLILLSGRKLVVFWNSLNPYRSHYTDIFNNEIKNGIIHGIAWVYRKYVREHSVKENLEMIRTIRFMLDLPYDAPITYHRLKVEAVRSIKNFDSIKHRTVIINPYSNSMNSTMSIYEMLCDKLNSLGYIVFTNVVEKQKAVKGSIPLKCSIYELYSIACQIPFIVSLRSGILDFLIPSGISMFVIYEGEIWESYSLGGWKSRCKIREIHAVSEEAINSIPKEFSLFLEELKAEGKIFPSIMSPKVSDVH